MNPPDFRSLCAELVKTLAAYQHRLEESYHPDSAEAKALDCGARLLDRAEAALAQPVAVSEKQLEDRFAAWWHDDGSGMPPLADEEQCEHVKRIANIAWHNGADVARHG